MTPDTEHSLAINTGIGTAGTNLVHIQNCDWIVERCHREYISACIVSIY